jgi:hypothetical protein
MASGNRRPRRPTALEAGLLVLPLALVLLPACQLVFPHDAAEPRPDAVSCEIEKRTEPRRCATDADRALGRKLTEAAFDLVSGQSSHVGLDFGDASLAACSGPEAVTFEDAAPAGELVCVGASTLPAGDVQQACEIQCLHKNGSNPQEAPGDLRDFCATHARPSVNAAAPFLGACADGKVRGDFVDPRTRPRPVEWINLDGVVTAANNGLVRNEIPPSPLPPGTEGFDAGASSRQIVRRGDAYVEFTAGGFGGARILGWSQGEVDGSSDKNDVGFGVRLTMQGRILITESGVLPEKSPGDVVWGAYTPDSRIRVRITELSDGRAAITYEQVLGPCDPNTTCMALPLRAPSGPVPYPFRVDTSFKEAGAEVIDVRIVYIE